MKPPEPGFVLKLFLAFSLYSNLKAVLSTRSSGKDTLTCLHGMRFIRDLTNKWMNFIFTLTLLSYIVYIVLF